MARRLLAIVPIVTSAAAVGLAIALLVSGTSTSNGISNYFLELNTSKIGQNIITITPANLDNSNDPLGSLLGGLDSIFGGLLTNLTGSIDKGIQDLEGNLLGNLTKALGIKDVYTLFLSQMCEGNYVDSSKPNSAIQYTSCSSYDNKLAGLRNITDSIPSSLVIGTSNISVPLITSLGSTMGSVTNLATGAAKAMFALIIISTVSVGLMMISSIMVFVLGYRRILVYISTAFGVLGSNVLLIFAAVVTGVILVGSDSVNDIGGGFGVSTKKGGPFLAISWVAAVLATIASTFWFMVWFVEFRRTALKRRWRTEREIGSYRGILHEVRQNLKKPPKELPPLRVLAHDSEDAAASNSQEKVIHK